MHCASLPPVLELSFRPASPGHPWRQVQTSSGGGLSLGPGSAAAPPACPELLRPGVWGVSSRPSRCHRAHLEPSAQPTQALTEGGGTSVTKHQPHPCAGQELVPALPSPRSPGLEVRNPAPPLRVTQPATPRGCRAGSDGPRLCGLSSAGASGRLKDPLGSRQRRPGGLARPPGRSGYLAAFLQLTRRLGEGTSLIQGHRAPRGPCLRTSHTASCRPQV